MQTISSHKNIYPFLNGGGQMGDLISHYDWSKTSIGSIAEWPLSLQINLGHILHSSFPMLLFWGDELYFFYNDAYRPILGTRGKHPAFGKTAGIVWPEFWDFISPLISRVMTTGKPEWFEDMLVQLEQNGKMEDTYWTFCYSAAFGDNGTIAGVIATCMETTETINARNRIQSEVNQRTQQLETAHASLLNANGYLQTIINLFKEPLQVLEPVMENNVIVDFRYKLTNSAYAAYASTTPDKIQDRKVGEVFPGYFQTSSFKNIAKAFESGTPDTWEIHYDVDGLDLYNEMSATRLDNEIVVHFTDFTKLKHLQIELIKKIDELERSNRQLEEFAHAASHDLKEPIRKIQVFTTLLKSQLSNQLNESEIKTFEKIERASGRMVALVDDLLLYSHVNLRPTEKKPVDLNEIIKQVLEDLELDIQQKDACVDFTDLPVIHGYRRQLQQMFQNLISNALKYSRDDQKPHIKITSEETVEYSKHFCCIKIQDNGIGFDQGYSEKIFEMFTRLHGKNEYSGTGIGLSIVKKVVENHNGSIKAESKPGNGAAFMIKLPLK